MLQGAEQRGKDAALEDTVLRVWTVQTRLPSFPVRQEISDPPAGRVRHIQLGELVLLQSQGDRIQDRAEVHQQDSGFGS